MDVAVVMASACTAARATCAGVDDVGSEDLGVGLTRTGSVTSTTSTTPAGAGGPMVLRGVVT